MTENYYCREFITHFVFNIVVLVSDHAKLSGKKGHSTAKQ